MEAKWVDDDDGVVGNTLVEFDKEKVNEFCVFWFWIKCEFGNWEEEEEKEEEYFMVDMDFGFDVVIVVALDDKEDELEEEEEDEDEGDDELLSLFNEFEYFFIRSKCWWYLGDFGWVEDEKKE